MARPLDHHLAAMLPGDLGQLAQRLEFGELRPIICIRNGSWTKSIAQRKRDVILPHDLADLAEALIEEALLVMREAPFRQDRAAARDDAGDAVGGEMDVAEPDACMD